MYARAWVLPAAILCLFLVAGPPHPAAAQTCLGAPARSGEVAFVGNRSARGATTSYGGRFLANLGGSASLGAGFSIDTFDDLAQNGFTSRLAVGVPRHFWKASACPVVAVAYSEVTPRSADGAAEEPLNSVTLATGVGFSFDLPLAESFSVGAHARPTLLYIRGEHARVRGGEGVADPDGSLHFGATLGAVLRLDRVFLGVETRRTTLQGAPAALLHVGMTR